jgi:predicted acetyltransferase
MIIRNYDPKKDQKAVHRIWEEIDWIDRDDEDDKKYLDIHMSGSRSLVADVNGAAECVVNSSPGSIQYLKEELPIAIVASVCTSLVGRKQGLASRLTAKLVAEDAVNGAIISVLGMFEQGYYSRLGFGTGPYEHFVSFDPSQLIVNRKASIPVRISNEDYNDVYKAMLNRRCDHGAVKLLAIEMTQWEMGATEKPFGLGYWYEKNILTHFIRENPKVSADHIL